MKTKITLLASLLLLIGGSKAKASDLIIDVKERHATTYFITVNNQTTYQTLEDISIKRLPAGTHHIQITKSVARNNRGRRGYGNNRSFQARERLVFDGSINIPARSDVFASLRQQNLFITDVVRKRGQRPNNNGRNRGPRRGGNDNFGGNNNGTCGTTGEIIYNDPIIEEPVIYEMAPQQFRQLKRTIQNETYENTKFEILESVIGGQYLSTNQVGQLIRLFTYENTKFKVAKLAYAQTIDPENYFTLNNLFTYSSTKRKLSRFISNGGR